MADIATITKLKNMLLKAAGSGNMCTLILKQSSTGMPVGFHAVFAVLHAPEKR